MIINLSDLFAGVTGSDDPNDRMTLMTMSAPNTQVRTAGTKTCALRQNGAGIGISSKARGTSRVSGLASRSASFATWGESRPENASIQWRLDTNRSSPSLGSTFSTRIVRTCFPLLTARSTSRLTKVEAFAARDITRTMQREAAMPRIISSPYSCPGRTSRGAIQHFTPRRSSPFAIAWAFFLSVLA